MTTIALLFICGAVLLALEVLVPGAVVGIIGGIVLIAGVLVAFDHYGADGGLIATLAALVLVAVTLYLEFVFLPRSRIARALSMSSTVAGTSQPALADRSIIGKAVRAVTPLVPSGVVECEGRRFEAFARSGHANAGEQLEVVDLDTFRLIVTQPSTVQTK